MPRIVRALPFLLLALWPASASDFAPVTIGQAHRIQSSVLGEQREYQVSVPGSYAWAKGRRYPVLYVLDGQTHFHHTAASVSFLGAQGEIPEMIVVAVTSTVRVRDFTQTDWASHWVGGGGAGNFKRFLSSELIPEIDRTYRTDGFRVLSGHSAGGQFVLHCLSSEPSLFQAYMALSPSLDWDDNLPQRELHKAFESTPRLRSFLYVARSDDSGRALQDYERLLATLETRSPAGFRWRSQPFPDETHGSMTLLAQIDALRRLYDGYRLHNDHLGKGLAYAEKHFQDVSKTVGWTLPVPEEVINSLGYAALSAGRVQEAIALFERNTRENAHSPNAFDSLAEAYDKAGMGKEAAGAWERSAALAIESNHPHRSYFVEQARKMKNRLAQEPDTSP